ncbi:MAG: hypothetical protein JXN64_00290 [Spirochaetes bacterium]|nr:hypothetical protein [Spirochaetota bacterium]
MDTEKDKFICDITQKSVDMIKACGYDNGKFEIDVNSLKKQVTIKFSHYKSEGSKKVVIQEIWTN